MPRARSSVAKSDDAGRDLRQALLRLMRGEPLHPDLLAAKRRGRLRISISSVAAEADRSRTLIGSDACAYPEVRRDVLAAAAAAVATPGPKVERRNAQQIIAALREENRLLQHEKAVLATRVQDAVNVARAQEERARRVQRRTQRPEGEGERPGQVVGLTTGGRRGQVLPFERCED